MTRTCSRRNPNKEPSVQIWAFSSITRKEMDTILGTDLGPHRTALLQYFLGAVTLAFLAYAWVLAAWVLTNYLLGSLLTYFSLVLLGTAGLVALAMLSFVTILSPHRIGVHLHARGGETSGARIARHFAANTDSLQTATLDVTRALFAVFSGFVVFVQAITVVFVGGLWPLVANVVFSVLASVVAHAGRYAIIEYGIVGPRERVLFEAGRNKV